MSKSRRQRPRRRRAAASTFGADVCRWWVSSLAYENDIKVDLEFFELAGESYRKVRNTLRFLLSNLFDFDPTTATPSICVTADSPRRRSTPGCWAQAAPRCSARCSAAYERVRVPRGAPAALRLLQRHAVGDLLRGGQGPALLRPAGLAAPAARRRPSCGSSPSCSAACSRRSCRTPPTRRTARCTATTACVHLRTHDRGRGRRAGGPGLARRSWPCAIGRSRRSRRRRRAASRTPSTPGSCCPTRAACSTPFAADLADLLGVSRVRLAGGGDVEVEDLRDEPRCERSWKRDGTVRAAQRRRHAERPRRGGGGAGVGVGVGGRRLGALRAAGVLAPALASRVTSPGGSAGGSWPGSGTRFTISGSRRAVPGGPSRATQSARADPTSPTRSDRRARLSTGTPGGRGSRARGGGRVRR